MPNPYLIRRTLYQALPGVACALIVAASLMVLVPLLQRSTGDRSWGEGVVLVVVLPPRGKDLNEFMLDGGDALGWLRGIAGKLTRQADRS